MTHDLTHLPQTEQICSKCKPGERMNNREKAEELPRHIEPSDCDFAEKEIKRLEKAFQAAREVAIEATKDWIEENGEAYGKEATREAAIEVDAEIEKRMKETPCPTHGRPGNCLGHQGRKNGKKKGSKE